MKSDPASVVNRPQDIGMAVVDDVLDMREDNVQIENKDKSNNTESAFFFPGARPGKTQNIFPGTHPGLHIRPIFLS